MNQSPQAVENTSTQSPEIKPRFHFPYVLMVGLILPFIVVGAYLLGKQTSSMQPKPVNPIACTEDAQICPDGSAVGRMPPNCEFAPCPITQITPAPTADETANWKKYENKKYGFSFNYPSNWRLLANKNEYIVANSVNAEFIVEYGLHSPYTGTERSSLKLIEEIKDYRFSSTAVIGNDKPQLVSHQSLLVGTLPAERYEINLTAPGLPYNKTVWIFIPYQGTITHIQMNGENTTFDQILSTFKFTNPTTIAPTTSPKINLTYQLPSGWQTVQDETGTFEIGFDPQTMKSNLNTKDMIGILLWNDLLRPPAFTGYVTLRLYNYDGGSRHNFIFTNMHVEPTKGDNPSAYREVEYLYNGRSCLFLENIYYSGSPIVWGMCDAGNGKAFLFTSSLNYRQILQTVRKLK